MPQEGLAKAAAHAAGLNNDAEAGKELEMASDDVHLAIQQPRLLV